MEVVNGSEGLGLMAVNFAQNGEGAGVRVTLASLHHVCPKYHNSSRPLSVSEV